MKTPRRTKSVGAKVTEDEYDLIRNASVSESVSDWLREVAITAAQRAPSNQVELLMAEVLALRRILLNLHAWPLTTEPFTAGALERLITESDALKMEQARTRLESGTAS